VSGPLESLKGGIPSPPLSYGRSAGWCPWSRRRDPLRAVFRLPCTVAKMKKGWIKIERSLQTNPSGQIFYVGRAVSAARPT